MDIFFQDPSEIPLPPDEVRIKELKVQPLPNDRRVRVYLAVDPFQRRPNLDLFITDEKDRVVSSAYIIESITKNIEITMHIRGEFITGAYKLKAILYYLKKDESDPEAEPIIEDPLIVHQKQVSFCIPE